MLHKIKGRRIPYTFTVDWWSFGCMVYEFVCGRCPFRTDAARRLDPDKHKAIDKATLIFDPTYPREFFSPELEDLLSSMCLPGALPRVSSAL